LPHQRLIDISNLPNSIERFAQSNRLASRLTQAGYVRIGLDHFAHPDDPLAKSSARRNFQGYTNDQTGALIGLGASAISKLPQGYAQNQTAVANYSRSIDETGFATARGHALTQDDKMRAFVIEQLMCDLAFSSRALVSQFGNDAIPMIQVARELVESDSDGLLKTTQDGFEVSPRGRPFVRSVAACFDAYLDQSKVQFSSGV
ncbi:MAG: coproporphyrinogen III oxidase, partial [Pseudomonadota bacterium]